MKNKKSEEPNDDNIKRDHYIYDKLDETQDFKVADGIVSFTRKFRYLGSLISYNLRDDEDIKARISQPQTHLWVHSKKYGAIPTSVPTTSTYCFESFGAASRGPYDNPSLTN